MIKLLKSLLILATLTWVMALGGCDMGDPTPPPTVTLTATSTPTLPAVTLTATPGITSTLTATATPDGYPAPTNTPEPYE